MSRIAHIDVDRQEHPAAIIGRDRERLGQALAQAALHDLGHLIGPHALRRHPLQGFRRWPVAAKPDLQEPIAAYGT